MVGFWRDCVLVSKYIPIKPECDTLYLSGMLFSILVLLLTEYDVRLLIGLSDWCRWVSVLLEIILVPYFFKMINFWYIWIVMKLCNFWAWRYLGVSKQSLEIWAPNNWIYLYLSVPTVWKLPKNLLFLDICEHQ